MTHEELLAHLTKARAVLDHYLVDDEAGVMRDDVAQLCIAIDEALPADPVLEQHTEAFDLPLEESAA